MGFFLGGGEGRGAANCKQTNERQAQIQPQVGGAGPRACRGVASFVMYIKFTKGLFI